MAAPKLDYKMLVLPLVMFGSKKIDFTDPNIVRLLQTVFVSVVFLLGTLYFYVYTRIQSKSSSKKIWVPPKAKPSLPFGLGPAPEPIKIEDFEATTYKEYELKLVKEAASPLVMTVIMTLFMSIKFNIHMSLVMQSIMVPLNAIDSLVLKKYLIGSKDAAYGELSAPPTAEYVKELNDKAAAEAATAAPAVTAEAAAAESEPPRVEELPSEPVEEKKKTAGELLKEKKAKKAAATTAANELD